MPSPFRALQSTIENYTHDVVGHNNMIFLCGLMIIVQLVPQLLARKRRKSTPTQGQDANSYLSYLYKEESADNLI